MSYRIGIPKELLLILFGYAPLESWFYLLEHESVSESDIAKEAKRFLYEINCPYDKLQDSFRHDHKTFYTHLPSEEQYDLAQFVFVLSLFNDKSAWQSYIKEFFSNHHWAEWHSGVPMEVKHTLHNLAPLLKRFDLTVPLGFCRAYIRAGEWKQAQVVIENNTLYNNLHLEIEKVSEDVWNRSLYKSKEAYSFLVYLSNLNRKKRQPIPTPIHRIIKRWSGLILLSVPLSFDSNPAQQIEKYVVCSWLRKSKLKSFPNKAMRCNICTWDSVWV